MLVGEQRENWQRLCTGASDASTIGVGRSLPKRTEDSAQRTGQTWLKGSQVYQYPLSPIPTCLVTMDTIAIFLYQHTCCYTSSWLGEPAGRTFLQIKHCQLNRKSTLTSKQQTVPATFPSSLSFRATIWSYAVSKQHIATMTLITNGNLT